MTTLSILRFPTTEGAQHVESAVLDLQKQCLIEIQDAAIVTWPQGARGPRAWQLHSLAGQRLLLCAFWGILFGLIFFIPFFGLAAGAAVGVLSNKFADYGIDDNLIEQARAKITEGTSALFLLTSSAMLDKAVEALKGQTFEILSTNLPKNKEDQLRAVFSAE